MSNHSTVVGIIPARYASTRLPGKPLVDIGGKPMIQRVYEQAAQCRLLHSVCVATDDDRIAQCVTAFGGTAIMTSPDHPSGTDRLAEAVQAMDADIVVNIQGDQPFLDPDMVDEAVQPLIDDPSIVMSSLMKPIEDESKLSNPAAVKVVVDRNGYALYFSRSQIPFARNETSIPIFEHIGLYVYRTAFLETLAGLAPTPLEQTESLEQLRVLEHGYKIRMVETQCNDPAFSGLHIDVPEDVERAEKALRDRAE